MAGSGIVGAWIMAWYLVRPPELITAPGRPESANTSAGFLIHSDQPRD